MEVEIIKALQKAVIAAVAGRVPVKYIGINFKKPNTGGWLEVVHIPNNILSEHWGPEKTFRGLLRLILHWPMDTQGVYVPLTLLESISGYFTKGSKLAGDNNVTLRITDVPNYLGPMEETPELLLPVSIQYEFFAA